MSTDSSSWEGETRLDHYREWYSRRTLWWRLINGLRWRLHEREFLLSVIRTQSELLREKERRIQELTGVHGPMEAS